MDGPSPRPSPPPVLKDAASARAQRCEWLALEGWSVRDTGVVMRAAKRRGGFSPLHMCALRRIAGALE